MTRFKQAFAAVLVLLFLSYSQAADTIRVACVGNSITRGAKLDADSTYPAKLGALLGTDYETQNFGEGGTGVLHKGNKPYVDCQAFIDVPSFQPNITVVMLGSNDSKPSTWTHKDHFSDDLTALVDTFATMSSDAQVWLCLPIPAFSTNFNIQDSVIVDEIIPLITEVSEQTNVPIIDTRTPFEGHQEYYDEDDIHLTSEGTTILAGIIHEALTDTGTTTSFTLDWVGTSTKHRSLAKKTITTGRGKIGSYPGCFAIYSIAGQRLWHVKPSHGFVLLIQHHNAPLH